MSDDDLQPFRLPGSGATPDAGAGPLGTGDDQHADAEGTPPEPGRPVTRGLAWAGLATTALAVLGGLWLPLATPVLATVALLIAASNRRRWDDFRTQTIVRTAMGLVVVAFVSTMGGFLYRDQRDAIREVPVLALHEGQCLLTLPDGITENRATVRRCGLEHWYYVAYTLTWPAGPQPDGRVLEEETRKACTAHLTSAYPSLARDVALMAAMDVQAFVPPEWVWTSGRRVTVCVVGRLNRTPLTVPSEDEIDAAADQDSALPRLGR